MTGSPGDTEAFAAAADRSTDLVAVHAWRAPASGWAVRPGIRAGALEAGLRRGQETLDDVLAPCLASWPSVPVRRVVLHRSAAVALPALALTAEPVVVGRRRHRPGHSTGPVASAVLREAGCPVLVVPAGA